MALTKCKECDRDVSDEAKTCPNCGAKIPKKSSLWKRILIGLVGVWAISLIAAGLSSNGSSSSSEPKPKTPRQEVMEGLKFDFSWTKGGLNSVMLLNATITNNSPYTIKDLVINCIDSANSGTKIDTNSRTAYETIAAEKTLKLREFNMGFIHNQATKSNCEVSDFEIVATKQVP